MKKFILLFFSVLLFSKIVLAAGFSSSSFSDYDVNEILEKIYLKVAVTVKINDKKVKGVLSIKEQSFDGYLTCSDKYKVTGEGKKDGENVAAKFFIYNLAKSKILYKITAKGNKNDGRWILYNSQDTAIAKGSFKNNQTEVIDNEAFTKFSKTVERFANACTLD